MNRRLKLLNIGVKHSKLEKVAHMKRLLILMQSGKFEMIREVMFWLVPFDT